MYSVVDNVVLLMEVLRSGSGPFLLVRNQERGSFTTNNRCLLLSRCKRLMVPVTPMKLI